MTAFQISVLVVSERSFKPRTDTLLINNVENRNVATVGENLRNIGWEIRERI